MLRIPTVVVALSGVFAAIPALKAGTLVNGDFSDSAVDKVGGIWATKYLNGGWLTYEDENAAWSISGGHAHWQNITQSPRALAQLWSNDEDDWFVNAGLKPTHGARNFTLGPGHHALAITYRFEPANANDTLDLELWSYNFSEQSANSRQFRSPNLLRTENRTVKPHTGNPSNTRYIVTDLADVSLPATSGLQTANVDFDLPAEQEFMAIRICSTLGMQGTLEIADIRIATEADVTIPEPAAYGLITLGLLTIRRRR